MKVCFTIFMILKERRSRLIMKKELLSLFIFEVIHVSDITTREGIGCYPPIRPVCPPPDGRAVCDEPDYFNEG